MDVCANTSTDITPRVRWNWLWGRRRDLLGTFVTFWLGFPLLAALHWTRATDNVTPDPAWSIDVLGQSFDLFLVAMLLYGPLVDGPHLWATVARTYVDPGERAARGALLARSLWLLALGPAVLLVPHGLVQAGLLAPSMQGVGMKLWNRGFVWYALYHIYKQHWGVVCLYNRKHGALDGLDQRVDAAVFPALMWLPYAMNYVMPRDHASMLAPVAPVLYRVLQAAFITAFAGYAVYQVARALRGSPRGGPKLLYVASVSLLYYFTFALSPRLGMFWVLATGAGHCVQYHAIVWTHGTKRYGAAGAAALPQRIFSSFPLYFGLGIVFALLTFQSPFADVLKPWLGSLLGASALAFALPSLDLDSSRALGTELVAALISGVRLHHFFVDGQIWRVSKQPEVAATLLGASAPTPALGTAR